MKYLPFPRMLGSALLVLSFLSPASGQTPAKPATPAEEYANVAAGRAEKIVAALGLPDTAQIERVSRLVADQYVQLHAIHSARDATLKELRAQDITNKPAHEAALQAAADHTNARLYTLHAAYLARLAAELTPEQIDQVKNGMTYGVLPLTYRTYLEMLPDLTAEQKRQILAWLIEAREFAIDAGSADEKHKWFGKYKGRINNYLSKAGIDMKQAEKAMLTRKNAAPAK